MNISTCICITLLAITGAGCVATGSSRFEAAGYNNTPQRQRFDQRVRQASIEPGVIHRGEGRSLWIDSSLQPGQKFVMRVSETWDDGNHWGQRTEYEIESIDALGNITLLVRPQRYWNDNSFIDFDSDRRNNGGTDGGYRGVRVGQEYRVVLDARGRCIDVPRGEELMVSWEHDGQFSKGVVRSYVADKREKMGEAEWRRMFFDTMVLLVLPEPLPKNSQWVETWKNAKPDPVAAVDEKRRRWMYTLTRFDESEAVVAIEEIETTRHEIIGSSDALSYRHWGSSVSTGQAEVDVKTGLVRRCQLKTRNEGWEAQDGSWKGHGTTTIELLSGPVRKP